MVTALLYIIKILLESFKLLVSPDLGAIDFSNINQFQVFHQWMIKSATKKTTIVSVCPKMISKKNTNYTDCIYWDTYSN